MISFEMLTRQEALRFAACNDEVLSEHFAKLGLLMTDHKIDADRLSYLDECAVTPGKDL